MTTNNLDSYERNASRWSDKDSGKTTTQVLCTAVRVGGYQEEH